MRKKIKKTAAALVLMAFMSTVYTGCAKEEVTGEVNEAVTESSAVNVSDKKETTQEVPEMSKEADGSQETDKVKATEAPKAEATKAPEKPSDKKETAVSTEAPKPASTKAPVAQSTPAPTAVPTVAPTQAPPHEHSWDGGSVTTAASCGSEGTMTYRCSCGATRTESIPATSHNWVEIVDKEPDCLSAGWTYQACTICNTSGDGWSTAALGHDVESYEKHGGDCNTPAQIGNTCRRCGADLGDTYGGVNPNAHTWETLTSEVFNEETFKWETITGTQCSGCGAIQ